MKMLNAQGMRSEEESVPRQGQKRRERFEQRKALARLQAHLRDEVRNRVGRAAMDGLSDFPI